jgi:cytidyltransferase-like protein
MEKKKVFVSGCFDMLHSGHIAFFERAAALGDLYVGLASDRTVMDLTGRYPIYDQNERKYM